MTAHDEWRRGWWWRRWLPGLAVLFAAFYGTMRGRQYEHGGAVAMAVAGCVTVALVSVALYLDVPLFGYQLSSTSERFESARTSSRWLRGLGVLLSVACVGMGLMAMYLILTGAP